ncbi:hypothetical protein VTL71DRAFT_15003 [Oculimacula yallundae]|uniref:non-specific serine/threonine protein kinase n=1 Tax=Oculimacula yallundae TaxID=86028 RepID=A0ABR4CFW6_9HELO
MSLEQDLDDFKLETTFYNHGTRVVHVSRKADRAQGVNLIVVEERWEVEQGEAGELGWGSFGTVRLEKRVDDGKCCRAVKELRKARLKSMNVDYKKELLALTKFSRSKFVQSQAFVQFFGWFEDPHSIFLAMEYFERGTLDNFITPYLPENTARTVSLQLLQGLKIMHEEKFTHRDLKPQNIFVVQTSPNFWVKIGDFGISKRVANDQTSLRSESGTLHYLAPEIKHYLGSDDQDPDSDGYTNAVDIWSFACVVYEMLAGHPPFRQFPRELKAFCRGGPFPVAPLQPNTSSDGIQFVESMLVASPKQRPSVIKGLNAPWLHHQPPAMKLGTATVLSGGLGGETDPKRYSSQKTVTLDSGSCPVMSTDGRAYINSSTTYKKPDPINAKPEQSKYLGITPSPALRAKALSTAHNQSKELEEYQRKGKQGEEMPQQTTLLPRRPAARDFSQPKTVVHSPLSAVSPPPLPPRSPRPAIEQALPNVEHPELDLYMNALQNASNSSARVTSLMKVNNQRSKDEQEIQSSRSPSLSPLPANKHAQQLTRHWTPYSKERIQGVGSACMQCQEEFTPSNHKQACLNCGYWFDEKCSSRKMALAHLRSPLPVKVCDPCFKWVTENSMQYSPGSNFGPNSVSSTPSSSHAPEKKAGKRSLLGSLGHIAGYIAGSIESARNETNKQKVDAAPVQNPTSNVIDKGTSSGQGTESGSFDGQKGKSKAEYRDLTQEETRDVWKAVLRAEEKRNNPTSFKTVWSSTRDEEDRPLPPGWVKRRHGLYTVWFENAEKGEVLWESPNGALS